MHYTRWYRHGDPLALMPRGRKVRDTMVRIMELVEIDYDLDCWYWRGEKLPSGYGQIFVDGRRQYPHRVTWQNANGPIPDGFHIHHRCRQRSCCNPEHLEPISASDHARLHHAEVV